MNSPAHDIATYLVANAIGALGGSEAWAISVSREAATPDDVITVYDTAGNAPLPDISLRDATIQVRVRGTIFTAAYAKAEAIFALLTQETTREIGGARYIGIWATSDIGAIGSDSNNRHLLTMNFRIERQPL